MEPGEALSRPGQQLLRCCDWLSTEQVPFLVLATPRAARGELKECSREVRWGLWAKVARKSRAIACRDRVARRPSALPGPSRHQ